MCSTKSDMDLTDIEFEVNNATSFPRFGVIAIKLSVVGAGHARDETAIVEQISRAWPAPTDVKRQCAGAWER
ncbi:MAG: hypothetical protein QX199_06030 [Methylococcaceae bacterium]